MLYHQYARVDRFKTELDTADLQQLGLENWTFKRR